MQNIMMHGKKNLVHLWKLSKIAELDEVTRQKGDSQLIAFLIKVRITSLNKTNKQLLQSQFVNLKNVQTTVINKSLSHNQSVTGDLAALINIKVNA